MHTEVTIAPIPENSLVELICIILNENDEDSTKTLAMYMLKHGLTLRSIGRSLATTAPKEWKSALEKLVGIVGYSYKDLAVPATDIKLLPQVTFKERELGCISQKWGETFSKIRLEVNQAQVAGALIGKS